MWCISGRGEHAGVRWRRRVCIPTTGMQHLEPVSSRVAAVKVPAAGGRPSASYSNARSSHFLVGTALLFSYVIHKCMHIRVEPFYETGRDL